MTDWLAPNPFSGNAAITRDQLREARKKIKAWMREQFGIRQQVSQREALTTIETVVEGKRSGTLDPKMRVLALKLAAPPGAINLGAL